MFFYCRTLSDILDCDDVGTVMSHSEINVLIASKQQLTNFMFYQVHLAYVGFELAMLVVIGTDCIGSCKSNYHTIMTTTPFHITKRKKTISTKRTIPSHLNSLNIKKIMTYAIGNPDPGLEQVQTCGGVKPVTGIPTLQLVLPLCEVNIQIVNTQRVVFPQDLPSEKQLHSC